MVNVDIQGKVYPPTAPYSVGREKIREFAAAVFCADPISLDVTAAKDAGYADLVAPPTFAIIMQNPTLAQLVEDPESGVDYSMIVHGDQRFTYTRPIVAGDELTAQMTVSSVKVLGGNAMVTAESAITDAEGKHVVTAISTLVVRGE